MAHCVLPDLELKSTCEETANVTVIPEQCCLVIAKDDIDCDVS